MRRFPRIAATAVALGLATVLLTPMAASADVGTGAAASGKLSWGLYNGPLTDLMAAAGPFDGARATAMMVGYKSSVFVLHVSGVDPSVAGTDFGAHLHLGTCVAYNGDAAGKHYNVDVVNGVLPAEVSDRTEVWLDFVVDEDGSGEATAKVPWVPAAGERSIVIHQEPTAPNGAAGLRQACLPFTIH